jgi:hypothetical protein
MQAQQGAHLNGSFTTENTNITSKDARKFYRSAGISYGLIAGISFVLFSWIRDAWLLSAYHAEYIWSKLFIGVPLALIICCLAGWLAAQTRSNAISVIVWAFAGGILGYVGGRLPYEGGNLAVWLLDERLNGQIIFPYGRVGTLMTGITTVVGVLLGAMLGGIQQTALDWAWDRSTDGNKMSAGSWSVLLVCVPVILLFTQAIDMQVNRPLREPLEAVSETVEDGLAEAQLEVEERSYGVLRPYIERLTPNYSLQIIEYDPDALLGTYVDVTFDNGTVLRCASVRTETTSKSIQRVIYCSDFSEELTNRVNDLVYAGIYGKRRWLAEDEEKFRVSDNVINWLQEHAAFMSDNYTVSKNSQKGEWIFVTTRFDSGFEMECRFNGKSPLIVEHCQAVGTLPAAVKIEPQADLTQGEETLPGIETIPISELAPEIPWLTRSKSTIPVVSFIEYNLDREYLSDPMLRQALSLAADKQGITADVIEQASQALSNRAYNRAPPQVKNAHQVENAGFVWYVPSDSNYVTQILEVKLSYQMARAATTFTHPDALGRALYGEVGLSYDPDKATNALTQAVISSGHELPEMTLVYLENPIHDLIINSLAEMWQQNLGILITPEPLSPEDYNDRLETKDYDLNFVSLVAEYIDPDAFLGYFLQSGKNWSGQSQKEFKTLIEGAKDAADDPSTRQALYIQAEYILCEDEALIIPLVHHVLDQ